MPISMRIVMEKSIPVLLLAGRVVAQGNTELRSQLEQLVAIDTPVKAINLTDVEFIDSYALGLILYYCTHRQGVPGRIYLVNATATGESYVDRLIKLADLHQTVSIVNNMEEIPAFKSGEDT